MARPLASCAALLLLMILTDCGGSPSGRTEGRGRVFYTALGHEAGVWQDARFQQFLTGAIRWAMGVP